MAICEEAVGRQQPRCAGACALLCAMAWWGDATAAPLVISADDQVITNLLAITDTPAVLINGDRNALTNNADLLSNGASFSAVHIDGADNVVVNSASITDTQTDALFTSTAAPRFEFVNVVSASVNGAGDGLNFSSSGVLDNRTGASITGALNGVRFDIPLDENAPYDVINDGTITGSDFNGVLYTNAPIAFNTLARARVDNRATGIIEGHFNGVDSDIWWKSLTVDNAGIIRSSAAAAGGTGVNARAGGTVINRTGALISGADRGISVEDDGVLQVHNRGTIAAENPGGAAINIGGPDIAFDNRWRHQVINEGTLDGNVFLGDAEDVLVNLSGTIDGDVFLGDEDDVFVRSTDLGVAGGISGTLDPGGGRDAGGFVTTGTETLNINALQAGFDKFAAGAIGPGATATLETGLASMPRTITIVGDATVLNNVPFDTSAVNEGHVVTLMPTFHGDPGSTLVFDNRADITTSTNNANAIFYSPSADRGQVDRPVVIRNSATITVPGARTAIRALSDDSVVTIENSGTISVQGGSFGNGIDAHAWFEITNSGTIESLTDGNGISIDDSENDVLAPGFIENTDSGNVRGHDTGIAASRGIAVINRGSVTGGNTGVSVRRGASLDNHGEIISDRDGVLISGSVVRNHEGGLIHGDADGSGGDFGLRGTVFAGAADITNAGTITGGIQLDDTDDRLHVERTSVINGIADAGNGIDTLVIDSGAGARADEGSGYVNFDTLDKQGEGVATLNGVFAFGATGTGRVSEGSLSLAAGSVLDVATLTVAGGAFLGGAGTVTGDVVGEPGANIGPGFSPGGPLVVLGDLDLRNGGSLVLEVASALLFDTLHVGGQFLLDGGTLSIELVDGMTTDALAASDLSLLDFFALVDPANPGAPAVPVTDAGIVSGTTLFANQDGERFQVSFADQTLGFAGASFDPAPVPLPPALWLLGTGAVLLLGRPYCRRPRL